MIPGATVEAKLPKIILIEDLIYNGTKVAVNVVVSSINQITDSKIQSKISTWSYKLPSSSIMRLLGLCLTLDNMSTYKFLLLCLLISADCHDDITF